MWTNVTQSFTLSNARLSPLSCRVCLQPWSNSAACSFLVIMKTLISWFSCVWLGSELNSAGKWILRARFAHPWPMWFQTCMTFFLPWTRLVQWCPILLLEGLNPAEFSSNPIPIQIIKVFMIVEQTEINCTFTQQWCTKTGSFSFATKTAVFCCQASRWRCHFVNKHYAPIDWTLNSHAHDIFKNSQFM